VYATAALKFDDMKLSQPCPRRSALLAGCTTTYVSPVEVTRFTGRASAIARSGPIAVRAGRRDADSLELAAFQAVARELQELGYVVTAAMARRSPK
jgi:hypothetical protein